MHIYNVFTLLSLLMTIVSGYRFGHRALVNRRGLGVQEAPALGILDRYARTRRYLLQRSGFSPLVPRAAEKRPKSSSGFQDDFSSQGPAKKPRLKPPPLESNPAQPREPRRTSEEDRQQSNFQHLPPEPEGGNVRTKSKSGKMLLYHTVTPDPSRFEATRNVKTGERSYFRKIGEGKKAKSTKRYRLGLLNKGNPSFLTATSPGQQGRYRGARYGNRPSMFEVHRTTGHMGVSAFPEWFKISPKPQSRLPPYITRAWTHEDLRRNLMQQHDQFEAHEAGEKHSVYAELDRIMRDMCDTQQCRVGPDPRLNLV